MPRRLSGPEPELRPGGYALLGARIVRVDALEDGTARVTVQGGEGPSAARSRLVDLEPLTCEVGDLTPVA